MLWSGMTEIVRGIGMMIGLALSFAIVPATAALLETIHPPEEGASSIYTYEDSKRKMVFIVGSSGTCASSSAYQELGDLSPKGAAPLLTQVAGGNEKHFKSHCQMSYDVQVITFVNPQSSSFPPDPIDRPPVPSSEGPRGERLRNL